jgi:RND superfamily putative drug exporter
MRLAGNANWWAPGPLRRFHDRFGIREHVDLDDEEMDDEPTSPVSAESAESADGGRELVEAGRP